MLAISCKFLGLRGIRASRPPHVGQVPPEIARIASHYTGVEMPVEIHWPEIALRLLLTLAAGSALGFDRSRTGHPAGLRTTLLVTLAASIAMIQMNLLIPTNGKPSDSYAVMDLMRLPLGILTGVGFIGAGAILRKNELVLGLTTAATLWFATTIGLCMGGGQLGLGSASTVIGFAVLTGLRSLEKRLDRYQRAEVKIVVQADLVTPEKIHSLLQAWALRIKSRSVSDCKSEHRRRFDFELLWPSEWTNSATAPPLVAELERLPGVIELEWRASDPGPQ